MGSDTVITVYQSINVCNISGFRFLIYECGGISKQQKLYIAYVE
jgi:hypothetical protein